MLLNHAWQRLLQKKWLSHTKTGHFCLKNGCHTLCPAQRADFGQFYVFLHFSHKAISFIVLHVGHTLDFPLCDPICILIPKMKQILKNKWCWLLVSPKFITAMDSVGDR